MVVVGALYVINIMISDAASAATDKIDGTCSSQTVGRCADKCPVQTDTLEGHDSVTGVAICQASTACPYDTNIASTDLACVAPSSISLPVFHGK